MPSDEEDFDATQAQLEDIRASSLGSVAVAMIETDVRAVAASVWSRVEPVIEQAGKAAGPILLQMATSLLESELETLMAKALK